MSFLIPAAFGVLWLCFKIGNSVAEMIALLIVWIFACAIIGMALLIL